MIVRVFRARVFPEKLEQWQWQVENYSIPWLTSQDGMLGHFPGKPFGDERDFVMVSLWQNLASLKQAVGENWSQAVLLEDEASLVEEVTVEHYESFGMSES